MKTHNLVKSTAEKTNADVPYRSGSKYILINTRFLSRILTLFLTIYFALIKNNIASYVDGGVHLSSQTKQWVHLDSGVFFTSRAIPATWNV